MPLDAPAPRVPRRWRTEDREEVALGIAHETIASRWLRGLDRGEDVLELHDLGRRHVAALAHAGLQQIVRALSLRLIHLLQSQAVPRKDLSRNEMPVCPLVPIEREHRLLPLLRRETLQKLRRRHLHRRRRRSSGVLQAQRRHGEDCDGYPSNRLQTLHDSPKGLAASEFPSVGRAACTSAEWPSVSPASPLPFVACSNWLLRAMCAPDA